MKQITVQELDKMLYTLGKSIKEVVKLTGFDECEDWSCIRNYDDIINPNEIQLLDEYQTVMHQLCDIHHVIEYQQRRIIGEGVLSLNAQGYFEDEYHEYHCGHIAYHLEYAETYYPERLQKLVDEGEIYRYLDDLDTKVTDAVNKQTEIWIKEDKAYQIALDKGDLYEVNRIANMHKEDAREAIYKVMVYV